MRKQSIKKLQDKLSEAAKIRAKEIVEARKAGIKLRVIGERYGISAQRVLAIYLKETK
jgi:hypothetical protein